MPRAFVVRPFGTRKDSSGRRIDFERVHAELIRPALVAAGLSGETAGEIIDAGSIREDMFALLLEADVVVCDITVHNANVFYEIGIRHSLRKKGTILIKGEPTDDRTSFDLLTDRYLAYNIAIPAASLESLKEAIRWSMASEQRTDSPIFQMFPALREADPDTVSVVPPDLQDEVERATAARSKGWLRLLSDEIRGRRFERTGWKLVGTAQWRLKDYEGAVRTWERVRSITPNDVDANLALASVDVDANLVLANVFERQSRESSRAADQRAVLLTNSDQALERVIGNASATRAERAEALALKGRNQKTRWRDGLARANDLLERRRLAVKRSLIESYESYLAAFQYDLNHFYPGLAAVQMGTILFSLSGDSGWNNAFRDNRAARNYREDLESQLPLLISAVTLAVQSALTRLDEKAADYRWTAISEADIQFLTSDSDERVISSYEHAFTDASPFEWDAAKGQLQLFADLGIRTERAHTVIDRVESVLGQELTPPAHKPTHVVVFAGLQFDAPGRQPPRFPDACETIASESIERKMEEFIGPDHDLVLLGSVSPGANILWHEACARLGLKTTVCLPMPSADLSRVFEWDDALRSRYLDIISPAHGRTILTLSDQPGLPRWLASTGEDPWSRADEWLIRMAAHWGADRVTLLAFWDGDESADSESGTAHVVKLAREEGSILVDRIDSTQLLPSISAPGAPAPPLPPSVEAISPAADESPDGPIHFPEPLLRAMRDRQCVLYAGAGMSATAGLPVWHEFAGRLLESAARDGGVPPGQLEQFQAALADGKTDYVVDGIVARASAEFLGSFLRSTFDAPGEVPRAYRVVSTLPFSALLTTNFDNLLERAFSLPADQVRTPQDVEAVLSALKDEQSFVLHLYGTLDRPETTLVSPAQFDDAISRNIPFRELMENLFVTRTILFIGCSLEGIEAYLRGLRFKRKSSRAHYAIAGVSGTGWQIMAGVLKDRYGIEVIPYEGGSAKSLEQMVDALRLELAASEPAAATALSPPLQRLTLENIGPFENLTLTLRPDVNVLLGDNGVGKSTILRAIAAVLAGRRADPIAAQMLRASLPPGTSSGDASIELTFGRNTYRTTIRPRGTLPPEIASPQVVPVSAEQILVLGFPALRTSSPVAARALQASEPVPDDVLPIALGGPDTRLSELRTWISRLDHQANIDQNSGLPSRSAEILSKLFKVIGSLAQGMTIELARVNATTQQILVRTDDGEIPLELISQGTASLISCVGVILQRLYEVFPDDPDPTRRQFLVLIDEIDAHMHPQWQRILLNRLRDPNAFPNMQLLATTHSPLIIADLPWDRVFHVIRGRDEERDQPGSVEVRQYEIRLDRLESNQILQSPLFALDYTQGEQVEKAQQEYARLRVIPSPSDTERARIDELSRFLFGQDAHALETATDRAYAAIERSLEKEIDERPVVEQQEMIDKARNALRKRLAQEPRS